MKVVIPLIGQKESRGTIGLWFKKEGDSVIKGEPLCTVETEKASIEIESPCAGLIRIIFCHRDAEVSVGDCIAIIAEKSEDISVMLDEIRHR